MSIIVPVLNEAERINCFLRQAALRGAGGDVEIIVVDGAGDGSTVRAIGDGGVVKLVSGAGRARQMNAGANAASGEVLLFLHADVVLPGDAIEQITAVMQDGRFVGGGFEIGYDSASTAFKLIAWRSNLRCRLSRIPYGDQGIFIRKDYFEQIGRYREINFLEDVDLMRRIKRDGKAICVLKSKVIVSSRRWQKEGILYCMIRNQVMVGLYMLGVHPDRLARFYR